ncbi:MAG: TonB C-terminal domain-containing protein [Proteobacteria bacterium]|nr:TonB C-terminal domain-containing protein [Pseudomonadota bacterium]
MLLSNRPAAWITALVLALPFHGANADVEAGVAAYKRGDFAFAFAEFSAAARQNDPLALNILGIMYADGVGVERNDKMAVDWFFKAQTLGSLEAGANLGRMYADGRGVPQSNTEALTHYRGSALGGYLPAMKRLAEIYERGELGVTPDPALALEWRARLLGTQTGFRYLRPAPVEPVPPPEKPHERESEGKAWPLASVSKALKPTGKDAPAQENADKKFEKLVMKQLEKYRQRERTLQLASTDTTPALAAYLKEFRAKLRNRLESAFPASKPPTTMIVSLSILRDGTVRGVELDQGSGNPKLDRKVLTSLTQLGHLPALPLAISETVDVLGVTVRLPIE